MDNACEQKGFRIVLGVVKNSEKVQHRKVCIRESLYTGKNQDQYI